MTARAVAGCTVAKSRHWRGRNNRQWARVRLLALKRDAWTCRECGRVGANEVDHRTPLAAGGAFLDLDNLQTLCRSCHIRKTARENGIERPPGYDDWAAELARLTTGGGRVE